VILPLRAGDHGSRSVQFLLGIKLVAGLGSHWGQGRGPSLENKSSRNNAKICVEILLDPGNADTMGMYRKRLLIVALALFAIIAICGLGFFAIGRDSLWWKLQKLGRVPDDARPYWPYGPSGIKVWYVAESTFWWGKPLDPAAFWKGRVIWNDHSAQEAAKRRGRGYPPIPTHLTNSTLNGDNVSSLSHKDSAPSRWSFSVDSGPIIRFRGNYAEQAYWDWFSRHQPRPPDILEERQFAYAERILEMGGLAALERKEAGNLGMPPEALTDDALFWTYVMKKRQQYVVEKATAARLHASLRLDYLFERLAVGSNFVTEPLTSEQLKSANAWKISYLRRLRREEVDDAYLSAYLKAWNLSALEVFGGDQIKKIRD